MHTCIHTFDVKIERRLFGKRMLRSMGGRKDRRD